MITHAAWTDLKNALKNNAVEPKIAELSSCLPSRSGGISGPSMTDGVGGVVVRTSLLWAGSVIAAPTLWVTSSA